MAEAARGRELALIDALVHLADTLVDDYDVIEFLQFLTERCVELSEVDEAAVMLTNPTGHLQSVAASTERTRLLELFELQNQDGPCLDAFRTGEVVVSGDLAAEVDRWPTFAPRAMEVGFSAVHSVPLRLRREVIGALNLLRVSTGKLDDADARLVRALSDIATIGLIQERTIKGSQSTSAGLQNALTSRIRIEQAKGVLAERRSVSTDAAFDMLRGYARHHRLKISEVAADIVTRRLDIATVTGGGDTPGTD